MSDVLNWIASDQNYNDGVSLYVKLGASDFYKKLFTSGLTPYNKTKLLDEMQKLCPAGDQKSAKAKPLENITIPTPQPEQVNAKDYERYLRIKQAIADLYLQANRAKFTLNSIKNRHILLQTALLLKKIKRGIMDYYKLIDHYDEVGRFPSLEADDIDHIKDPAKKVQLLRQSNAKAKARLADKDCKTRVKTEKLLKFNEQLIAKLLIKMGRK
jgi:hypothetical protein